MRNFVPLAGCLALGFASTASAVVTFNFQADKLKDQNGTPAPVGSLFLIVASEGDSTFGPIAAGSSLTVGTKTDGTSGNDFVVYRNTLNVSGYPGTLNYGTVSLPDLPVNTPLEIVWFPSLFAYSSNVVAGVSYGTYTNAAAVDGSAAWLEPADNSQINLGFFTKDSSVGTNFSPPAGAASNAIAAGNASQVVTVVPEPGSAGLLMVGLAALGFRRRRP